MIRMQNRADVNCKMVGKNEEVQEQTKRLRFKPLTSVQQCSGDGNLDKNVKETKQKGI